MSKRTNEELVKILTVDRTSYQPAAIEAAEKEIEKRNIDNSKIKELQSSVIKTAEEQKQIESNKVSAFTRFIHFIVDTVAFFIVAFVLSLLLEPFLTKSNEEFIVLIIILISFFSYYTFMETKYQKTIGKFITGTKVITKDGNKPETGDVIRRTACRLIPFDRVSFFFAANGFHDSLSDTRVVKDKRLRAGDENTTHNKS